MSLKHRTDSVTGRLHKGPAPRLLYQQRPCDGVPALRVTYSSAQTQRQPGRDRPQKACPPDGVPFVPVPRRALPRCPVPWRGRPWSSVTCASRLSCGQRGGAWSWRQAGRRAGFSLRSWKVP